MPLVHSLPLLEPYFLAFARVFSQPQLRHFRNYVQGLLCLDERRTLARLRRHVLESPHASNWDRFVTTAPWNREALFRAADRLLRKELRTLQPQGLRLGGRMVDLLLFDDSHAWHLGRKLEGAGWHWEHGEGQAHWGHCLLLAAYRTGDYTFPYRTAVYVKEKDLPVLNWRRRTRNRAHPHLRPREARTFRSKVAWVVAILAAWAPLRAGRAVLVLFDSWYLNQETVRAAVAKKLDWASVLKQNRKLTLLDLVLETGEVRREQKLTVAQLLTSLEPAAGLKEGEGSYRTFSPSGGLVSFAVAGAPYRAISYRARVAGLGVVQVVVAQKRWHDRWSPWVPLVTNRLDLTAQEVVRVYAQRWPIESLIRDAKQELGLTDCQMQPLEGTETHSQLVGISQLLLTLLRLRADAGQLVTATGKRLASVGRTLGEVRQFVKQVELAELVRWTWEQAQAGGSVEAALLRLELPA